MIAEVVAFVIGIITIGVLVVVGPAIMTTLNTSMPVASNDAFHAAALQAPNILNSGFGIVAGVVSVIGVVIIIGAIMYLNKSNNRGGGEY